MDDLGMVNRLEKIPVFIGEGHYEVLGFVSRHIDAHNLPREGNVIVKIDALPDQVIPKEMIVKSKVESQKRRLFSDIGMHDWIRKAAENGWVKNVVWVKPPWSKISEDGTGIKEIQKSDGSKTDVTIDVKTLGKTLFDVGTDDWADFSKTVSKCISKDTPWILDIDLTFFCTINPFLSMFQTEEFDVYPLLLDIFAYETPLEFSQDGIKNAIQARDFQLKELEDIFKYLDEHRVVPDDKASSEYYERVVELRNQLLKHFQDDHIDWRHIFEAGTVCNDLQLPVQYNKRPKVLEMLEKCFEKILDSFESHPTIITIARSSENDVFVPIKDCNFIEQNLVKVLKKKFNLDEPEMPYLDY